MQDSTRRALSLCPRASLLEPPIRVPRSVRGVFHRRCGPSIPHGHSGAPGRQDVTRATARGTKLRQNHCVLSFFCALCIFLLLARTVWRAQEPVQQVVLLLPQKASRILLGTADLPQHRSRLERHFGRSSQPFFPSLFEKAHCRAWLDKTTVPKQISCLQ